MGRAEGKTHLKVESPTRLLVTKMLRRNGFKLHFTLLANPRGKKRLFLNSRFRNSYFPSCQKKQQIFFQLHWDSVLLWFLPFCLAKIPQTHPQH